MMMMFTTKHFFLALIVTVSSTAVVLSAPIAIDNAKVNVNGLVERSAERVVRQESGSFPAPTTTAMAVGQAEPEVEMEEVTASEANTPPASATASTAVTASSPSASASAPVSALASGTSSAAKPSSSAKSKDAIHFKNDFPDSFTVGDNISLQWEGGDGHYQLYAILQYPGLSNIRPINLERNTTSTSYSYTIDFNGEQYHDGSKLTIGIASTSDDKYGFERITKPLKAN
ncbi:hypothetical protein IAU59_004735 [Kwoniella sp. CBS 9459]